MWNQIMKLSYAGAFNPPLPGACLSPPRTSVGSRGSGPPHKGGVWGGGVLILIFKFIEK